MTTTEHPSYLRAAARSARLESEIAAAPGRFQVLTGDRPTGPLYLGHYLGTLANRVRLQDASVDPAHTTVFAHRAVPALNQLLLPFLALVSVAELHRNPTVKAEVEAADHRALSGLLLTYPVHQAADILFCGANLVPVGRETRGNALALRDDEDRTGALLRRARTEAERTIAYDPDRRPEVANLLLLAALCSDRTPEQVATEIGEGGASRLKAVVTEAVNERLRPLRRRRAALAADPGYRLDVLAAGNAVANELADATLRQVRQRMHMQYQPVA